MTTMTKKEVLRNCLDELTGVEFKRFKTTLRDQGRIAWGKLEKADTDDTVDLMVEAHSMRARNKMWSILKKMNLNQLAIDLGRSPKKKAPRPKKAGPSVGDLVVKAVSASKEKKGVSLSALKKALAAGGYDVKKNNTRVKLAVKSLVSKGTLVQTKGTGASGSFKLNKQAEEKKKPVKKAAPKAKKPAAKKPAAAKKPKKAVAKKPAAAKKSPKKAKKPAAPKKATKSPKKAVAKKPAAAKKSPKKKAKKPAAPKKATKSPKKAKKPAAPKKAAKSPKKAKAAKPKAAKPKAAKPKKAAPKKK